MRALDRSSSQTKGAVIFDSQSIGLELTDAAKVLLAKKGYDATLGARPLRRALQRLVEDPISEKILFKEFRAGETIIVDAVNEEMVFSSIERIVDPPVELAGQGSGPGSETP